MSTNTAQATPRTDAHTYGGKEVIGAGYVSADFARQLERENASLLADRDRLRAALEMVLGCFGNERHCNGISGDRIYYRDGSITHDNYDEARRVLAEANRRGE